MPIRHPARVYPPAPAAPEGLAPGEWNRRWSDMTIHQRLQIIEGREAAAERAAAEEAEAHPRGMPHTAYVRHWKEGRDPEDIALEAGVKASTVRRAIADAARADPTITPLAWRAGRPHTSDEYTALRDQGLTTPEIARTLGVTEETARTAFRRLDRDSAAEQPVRTTTREDTLMPPQRWADPGQNRESGGRAAERTDYEAAGITSARGLGYSYAPPDDTREYEQTELGFELEATS